MLNYFAIHIINADRFYYSLTEFTLRLKLTHWRKESALNKLYRKLKFYLKINKIKQITKTACALNIHFITEERQITTFRGDDIFLKIAYHAMPFTASVDPYYFLTSWRMTEHAVYTIAIYGVPCVWRHGENDTIFVKGGGIRPSCPLRQSSILCDICLVHVLVG